MTEENLQHNIIPCYILPDLKINDTIFNKFIIIGVGFTGVAIKIIAECGE